METVESQVARENEIKDMEKHKKDISSKAKLATKNGSDQIIKSLNHHFLLSYVNLSKDEPNNVKLFTYVTNTNESQNIQILTFIPAQTEQDGYEKISSGRFEYVESHRELLLKKECDLKALPKSIRDRITVPSHDASLGEKRDFITAVNDGLTANIDQFSHALKLFWAKSEEG